MNGCPYRDRKDAGNLELDWLEVQLKMYRDRNMQVCVLKNWIGLSMWNQVWQVYITGGCDIGISIDQS